MSSTLDDMAMLVTPKEAASRLRIGRSKIYELMRVGDLPSLKIGGSRRITTEALAKFISRLEEGS